MRISRVMFAAVKSGSGKTVITSAVMRMCMNAGRRVAPFKTGPDYIDPMYHRIALGGDMRILDAEGDIASGGNLDTYFTNPELTRALLCDGMQKGEDLAIIEGVMGLYDGVGGMSLTGSSYDLASVTDTPIILTADVKGMGRSMIAMLKGFLDCDKKALIKGVILNRISGMYYDRIKETVENELDIKVLGYVPEDDRLDIKSRHLGLLTPDVTDVSTVIDDACEILTDSVDLEQILKIADGATDLSCTAKLPTVYDLGSVKKDIRRIAVAMDEAFCFYYRENLRMFKRAGIDMVPFSPLHDSALPEGTDAIILGGGYPESYLTELSRNTAIVEDIRRAHDKGTYITAECGGFMYLHDTITSPDGTCYKMAGIIPGDCHYTGKLVRFGYVQAGYAPDANGTEKSYDSDRIAQSGIISIKGHEFHYYESDDPGESVLLQKPGSGREYRALHCYPDMIAGFTHFYYPSVEACK